MDISSRRNRLSQQCDSTILYWEGREHLSLLLSAGKQRDPRRHLTLRNPSWTVVKRKQESAREKIATELDAVKNDSLEIAAFVVSVPLTLTASLGSQARRFPTQVNLCWCFVEQCPDWVSLFFVSALSGERSSGREGMASFHSPHDIIQFGHKKAVQN